MSLWICSMWSQCIGIETNYYYTQRFLINILKHYFFFRLNHIHYVNILDPFLKNLLFIIDFHRYATSNNIQAEENGQLRTGSEGQQFVAKSGSYSFTGQDGVVYTVTYTADENGFKAEGAHIPKALI